MSLKTKKFNDSVVMKSFKHLALEKGMIKPEEIKKEAKAVLDLNPVEDFTSNVMKLIAGLRKDGLEKFANDLEDHFVNYKMAESSYGVHKETGDDLVDMAHPKGSHKLEGVLGDATIETILDNHLKMMQIVNKKPSGKLSSAKEIINAVKVSLAEDEMDIKRKNAAIKEIKKLPAILDKINPLIKNLGISARLLLSDWADNIKSESDDFDGDYNVTKTIMNDLFRMNYKLKDTFGDEGQKFILDQLISIVGEARATVYSAQQYLSGEFNKYLNNPQSLEKTFSVSDIVGTLSWFSNKIKTNILDKEESFYASKKDSDPNLSTYDKAYDSLEYLKKTIDSFSTKLIDFKTKNNRDVITQLGLNSFRKSLESPFFANEISSKEDVVNAINILLKSFAVNILGLDPWK